MRQLIFPLFAAAALSSAPASAFDSAGAPVRIELQPQVVAHGEHVMLGDIAILRTRDLPTMQRLVSLPMGQAPHAGSEVVIRREVVERWVRSQLGIARRDVEWTGTGQSVVRSLSQEFPALRIEQAASAALREWLAQHATRYTVDAQGLPADIKLPAGAVEIVPRPPAAGAEPASRMVVWVDVKVDGRVRRTVGVNLAVEAYRDAWVAPAPVAAGVALMPGMLLKRETPITGRAAPKVAKDAADGDSWHGLRTTRALKEGEAVTQRNAAPAPAPAIARGDWVALHMKSGLVELESRAQALQDGEVGQVVQVRSSNGAGRVTARVLAPGRVEALL